MQIEVSIDLDSVVGQADDDSLMEAIKDKFRWSQGGLVDFVAEMMAPNSMNNFDKIQLLLKNIDDIKLIDLEKLTNK